LDSYNCCDLHDIFDTCYPKASNTISLTVGLVLIARGQTVDNQTTVNASDFSIDIPDNWSYTQDLGLQIHSTPKKFAFALIGLTESQKRLK
jgi:hypothetical protein